MTYTVADVDTKQMVIYCLCGDISVSNGIVYYGVLLEYRGGIKRVDCDDRHAHMLCNTLTHRSFFILSVILNYDWYNTMSAEDI